LIARIGPGEIERHVALGPLPAVGVEVPAAPACSLAESRTATGPVKRVIDVVCATLVLLLTLPLSAVIAISIKIEDGGPVFFRQRRVGRNGIVFSLRKFRSMAVNAEAETGPVWAQTDDPRITRVGRWMRPLGIDEIPQAWNVLRGEMSLVGPRPERPEFVGALTATIPGYPERHLVRPGITGWAQVNLRHDITLASAYRKLDHDLHYVRACSLRLDGLILWLTVKRTIFAWPGRAQT
jgi:lipopolysaccharide/colanic/teichoic acid biosynthesis glycosyltransferase